jgi:hypothetical protein
MFTEHAVAVHSLREFQTFTVLLIKKVQMKVNSGFHNVDASGVTSSFGTRKPKGHE